MAETGECGSTIFTAGKLLACESRNGAEDLRSKVTEEPKDQRSEEFEMLAAETVSEKLVQRRAKVLASSRLSIRFQ